MRADTSWYVTMERRDNIAQCHLASLFAVHSVR